MLHRDLKPENILLDCHEFLRVIDFGLAKSFGKSTMLTDTTCGTPLYVAPEVIRKEAYSAGADIWSAGIILYMMAVGSRPFPGSNIKTVIANVLAADPAIPETLSPELHDLLGRMLAKSPDARIDVSGIKAHPWFAGYTDWATFPVNVTQLKVCGLDSFDSVVVTEMKALRIDTSRVVAELNDAARSEAVVVYKMLRREHICHLLADAARREMALKTTTMPGIGKKSVMAVPKPAFWPEMAPAPVQPKPKSSVPRNVISLPLARKRVQKRWSLAPDSFPKLEGSEAAE
jgi:serine/threonine protein kinase